MTETTMVPGLCSQDGTRFIGRDMAGLRVMNAAYLPGAAAEVSNTGIANTAQSVGFLGTPTTRVVLETIHFSYSATPAAGSYVEVQIDGVQVFFAFITAGGPGPLSMLPPLVAPLGALVLVTLSAGGGSVIGALTCRHYLMTDV